MVHVCYLNRKYVKLTHEMGAADKRRDPKLLVNGCMPQEERISLLPFYMQCK